MKQCVIFLMLTGMCLPYAGQARPFSEFHAEQARAASLLTDQKQAAVWIKNLQTELALSPVTGLSTSGVPLFEIIYENWDNSAWEKTDRYLLSKSLIPIHDELKDYELLLIFFLYAMMSTGANGDVGEAIAAYAPLMLWYADIMDLIMAFEYALHQEWEDNQWNDDYKITSKKNVKGETTEVRMSFYEEGRWHDAMLVTFTHSQGNFASATLQAISDNDYTLKNLVKLELSYQDDDLTQLLFYQWKTETSTWQQFSKLIYTYTNNLLMKNTLQYSVTNGSTWFDIYTVDYGYDANNYLSAETAKSADLSSISINMEDPIAPLTLVNSTKITYTYDTSGNVLDMQGFEWKDNAWTKDTREEYEFDGFDREIKNINSYGDEGVWIQEEQIISDYGGTNFLLTELLQSRSDNSWIDDEKTSYTYVSIGDTELELYEILYEKMSGDWEKEMHKLYNFNAGTSVDPSSQKLPQEFRIANYPNPFNPITTIQWTLPEAQNVTVQIFNVQGQLVQSLLKGQYYPAGICKAQWNGVNGSGEAVPSGAYLYQIQTGSVIQVGKCLLMK